MAALLLAAALGWSGCDRDTPAGRRAGSGGDTAAWTLAPEPEVRLDASGGRELDRVFSGFIRPDGSFVVGNSGTSEVLFFGADGRLLRASGREGQGPGEFQAVSWVGQLPGDSVLAYDVRAGRYSVLDPAGGFARSFSPRTPMGERGRSACLPTGRCWPSRRAASTRGARQAGYGTGWACIVSTSTGKSRVSWGSSPERSG